MFKKDNLKSGNFLQYTYGGDNNSVYFELVKAPDKYLENCVIVNEAVKPDGSIMYYPCGHLSPADELLEYINK